METELSVGMREVDLRVWMNTIDMSSKQVCITQHLTSALKQFVITFVTRSKQI